MWDLPGPGLEPTYPALAGWFLTTAPLGKSPDSILNTFKRSEFVLKYVLRLKSSINLLCLWNIHVRKNFKLQVDFWTVPRPVVSQVAHFVMAFVPYSERRSQCTGHPWTVGKAPLGPLLGRPLWIHTGPRMCTDRRRNLRGLRAAQLPL